MKIHHHHFETLSSTSDWAKERLASFEKEALTVISADHQTHGRGQFGKKWFSPKGKNLYASFCFFIPVHKRDPLILTHLLMNAQMRILEERGILCTFKWPNDILLGGKKLAGILCETTAFPPFTAVIMGMGLNVNMDESFLQKIDQPATSLFNATGKVWNKEDLLESLKDQFLKDLIQFKDSESKISNRPCLE